MSGIDPAVSRLITLFRKRKRKQQKRSSAGKMSREKASLEAGSLKKSTVSTVQNVGSGVPVLSVIEDSIAPADRKRLWESIISGSKGTVANISNDVAVLGDGAAGIAPQENADDASVLQEAECAALRAQWKSLQCASQLDGCVLGGEVSTGNDTPHAQGSSPEGSPVEAPRKKSKKEIEEERFAAALDTALQHVVSDGFSQHYAYDDAMTYERRKAAWRDVVSIYANGTNWERPLSIQSVSEPELANVLERHTQIIERRIDSLRRSVFQCGLHPMAQACRSLEQLYTALDEYSPVDPRVVAALSGVYLAQMWYTSPTVFKGLMKQRHGEALGAIARIDSLTEEDLSGKSHKEVEAMVRQNVGKTLSDLRAISQLEASLEQGKLVVYPWPLRYGVQTITALGTEMFAGIARQYLSAAFSRHASRAYGLFSSHTSLWWRLLTQRDEGSIDPEGLFSHYVDKDAFLNASNPLRQELFMSRLIRQNNPDLQMNELDENERRAERIASEILQKLPKISSYDQVTRVRLPQNSMRAYLLFGAAGVGKTWIVDRVLAEVQKEFPRPVIVGRVRALQAKLGLPELIKKARECAKRYNTLVVLICDEIQEALGEHTKGSSLDIGVSGDTLMELDELRRSDSPVLLFGMTNTHKTLPIALLSRGQKEYIEAPSREALSFLIRRKLFDFTGYALSDAHVGDYEQLFAGKTPRLVEGVLSGLSGKNVLKATVFNEILTSAFGISADSRADLDRAPYFAGMALMHMVTRKKAPLVATVHKVTPPEDQQTQRSIAELIRTLMDIGSQTQASDRQDVYSGGLWGYEQYSLQDVTIEVLTDRLHELLGGVVALQGEGVELIGGALDAHVRKDLDAVLDVLALSQLKWSKRPIRKEDEALLNKQKEAILANGIATVKQAFSLLQNELALLHALFYKERTVYPFDFTAFWQEHQAALLKAHQTYKEKVSARG